MRERIPPMKNINKKTSNKIKQNNKKLKLETSQEKIKKRGRNFLPRLKKITKQKKQLKKKKTNKTRKCKNKRNKKK